MVYCCGLFEYLTDKVCGVLMDRLFDLVSPEGLLVVGCLDSNSLKPKIVESMLEWHMIYRSRDQVQSLRPTTCDNRAFTIQHLPPGVLLLEARK
jgi:extracellular factor (EF) 3-hydroxypalmitic acid methyl ester biosynthesis protein